MGSDVLLYAIRLSLRLFEKCLIQLLKIILSYPAYWAAPLGMDFFKGSSGLYAMIGVTNRGVVYIPTHFTFIQIHVNQFLSHFHKGNWNLKERFKIVAKPFYGVVVLLVVPGDGYVMTLLVAFVKHFKDSIHKSV